MNINRSLYLVVGLAVGLVVLYFYKIDRGYSWRHSPLVAPWIEGTCIYQKMKINHLELVSGK